ncbi:MAG TPA: DUF3194 domain-containing protein [Methanothermobacter sp.]|nr:conserved hypothetical protein [Methanothermobacter sp. MT-2]HHW05797.1 DUF3194 domain-containing protein [Methanothermobacter sp.]HOK72484.1 DUF3194 domain-containing protein [Methanothermobacter sp.]HOL69113.1 DUF3194 domain-containing protein [Methanothermobacter sp.]HPQ03971.1 DUF3194 domain-containing protein [Methanothermobacter sp.]
MKKLTKEDSDKIANLLSTTIEEFIFSRIPKKEIRDLDITIILDYEKGLDVNISIELIPYEFSKIEPRIADEAIKLAYKKLDQHLDRSP